MLFMYVLPSPPPVGSVLAAYTHVDDIGKEGGRERGEVGGCACLQPTNTRHNSIAIAEAVGLQSDQLT